MLARELLAVLAPESPPAERLGLGRVATLVRLVHASRAPVGPTRERLAEELEALRRRELAFAGAALIERYLASMVRAGPRRGATSAAGDRVAETADASPSELWEPLLEARRRGAAVPGLPEPEETADRVCARLLEGAEELGLAHRWVAERRARLRSLADDPWGTGREARGAEDPRVEEGHALLAALGPVRRGHGALLFDAEGDPEAIASWGERPTLGDWAGLGRALRRARFATPGALLRVGESVGGARAFLAPIGLLGRVHALVFLITPARGAGVAEPSLLLASLHDERRVLRWRLAQFRSWHRAAYGRDPWFDPASLAWSGWTREVLARVRAGESIRWDGPESLQGIARRWERFERGGEARCAGVRAGAPVDLPALADRRDELPRLARRWLGRLARAGEAPRLDEDALRLLWRHPWRPDGAELGRCLARALRGARARGEVEVTGAQLRAVLRARGHDPVERVPSRTAREADLVAALHTTRHANGNWNRSAAARMLGWDLATLTRRLRAAGLVTPRKVGDASGVPR